MVVGVTHVTGVCCRAMQRYGDITCHIFKWVGLNDDIFCVYTDMEVSGGFSVEILEHAIMKTFCCETYWSCLVWIPKPTQSEEAESVCKQRVVDVVVVER